VGRFTTSIKACDSDFVAALTLNDHNNHAFEIFPNQNYLPTAIDYTTISAPSSMTTTWYPDADLDHDDTTNGMSLVRVSQN